MRRETRHKTTSRMTRMRRYSSKKHSFVFLPDYTKNVSLFVFYELSFNLASPLLSSIFVFRLSFLPTPCVTFIKVPSSSFTTCSHPHQLFTPDTHKVLQFDQREAQCLNLLPAWGSSTSNVNKTQDVKEIQFVCSRHFKMLWETWTITHTSDSKHLFTYVSLKHTI